MSIIIDSFYVERRKLQILGYETRQVQPFIPPDLGWSNTRYGFGGDFFGPVTRGRGDLGLGFGNTYEHRARTSRTAINRVSAAFDIKFHPTA